MRTHEDSESVEIVEDESEPSLARESESLRDMEIPENAVAIVERRDRAVVVTDEDRKDRIIEGILGNGNGNRSNRNGNKNGNGGGRLGL